MPAVEPTKIGNSRKPLSLPEAFIQEMRTLFEQFGKMTEWPAFLNSFQVQSASGIRANSLKINVDDLKKLLADDLGLPLSQFRPIHWSTDGLYCPADLSPGRLPHYTAGLYYIQEPSAMLPAVVLAAKPGEKILDLCAAPGGKTCKIAADLKGQGLIWANEISAERARALLRNVELMGCTNCLITQETPERLAERLPEYFDRVLVDAPCSGSGMFRRDPAAIGSWLGYGSQHCVRLQQEILRFAWSMLKPGGYLVYSTCTFSIAENEAMIVWLTEQYPDCQIVPITKPDGISDGMPIRPDLPGTARIWPHLAEGDGHFCALVQKKPAGEANDLLYRSSEKQSASGKIAPTTSDASAWSAFWDFCRLNLSACGMKRMEEIANHGKLRYDFNCLHILPSDTAIPEKLKKVKTGLFLGQIRVLRDGRHLYEPSPAFLLCLNAGDLLHVPAGSFQSDLIRRYLRGESINLPGQEGLVPGQYLAVGLTGCKNAEKVWPLGWAKFQPPSQLKNLYPQAWRRLI